MSKQCPPWPEYTVDRSDFRLKNTSLVVSTRERSVGTIANLSCKNGYELMPNEPTVLCQEKGTWNYTQQPDCQVHVPEPSTLDGLTSTQRIIIYVAGGFGALMLIVLVVVIVAIILKRRRQIREKRKDESREQHERQRPGYNSSKKENGYVDRNQWENPAFDSGYDGGAVVGDPMSSAYPHYPYPNR